MIANIFQKHWLGLYHYFLKYIQVQKYMYLNYIIEY